MSLCFLTQNYRHAYDLIQKLYPSLTILPPSLGAVGAGPSGTPPGSPPACGFRAREAVRDAAEEPGSCRKPEVGKAACLGEGAPGERQGVLSPVLARGRGGRTAGVELRALWGPPSPAEDVTGRSGAAAGPGVGRSQRKANLRGRSGFVWNTVKQPSFL